MKVMSNSVTVEHFHLQVVVHFSHKCLRVEGNLFVYRSLSTNNMKSYFQIACSTYGRVQLCMQVAGWGVGLVSEYVNSSL